MAIGSDNGGSNQCCSSRSKDRGWQGWFERGLGDDKHGGKSSLLWEVRDLRQADSSVFVMELNGVKRIATGLT